MTNKDQMAIAKLYSENYDPQMEDLTDDRTFGWAARARDKWEKDNKRQWTHPNVKDTHDKIEGDNVRLRKIASKYNDGMGERFLNAVIAGEISKEDSFDMIVNLLRNNSGKSIVEWILG